LLGIDPSRRLQDTLGVALADLDTSVPGAGALRAAIVHPHQAIERWVAETSRDPQIARRVAGNAFFVALGDRLATATDVLAAARIAEWAERDPELTDLVVDTAPGISAIDFLRSPRQLEALVKGRMIRWLRAAARTGAPLGRGARRVLAGFTGIAGARMVLELADFFALVQEPLEQLLRRVEHTRRWLASDAAELLLVTSPRDAGARGASQMRAALASLGLAPHAVIVNRTWPVELAAELAAIHAPAAAGPLIAYLCAYLNAQARVIAATATWGPVVTVASQPDLADRDKLTELGARVDRQLRGAAAQEISCSPGCEEARQDAPRCEGTR
jgi:anion-transporting  ArsA/GET3 family ATPase